MSDLPAPIIVKRKKKVIAGGHHGGAWKVAYADFVTAMMAFFLMMWLLGATTEKQRKGIADYFNPTIPVNKVSGGGDGAFGGDSVFTDSTLAKNGSGAGVTLPTATAPENGNNGDEPDESAPDTTSKGKDQLSKLEEMLTGKSGDSMVSDLLRRHVVTRVTDEGLIVEFFDVPGAPLFDGAEPNRILRNLTAAVAEVFQLASNDIAVQGHVASVPQARRINPVWESSAERADVVRQMLTDAGLSPKRMQRVTGFADRKPVSADPLSIRNNRMEIILLRSKL